VKRGRRVSYALVGTCNSATVPYHPSDIKASGSRQTDRLYAVEQGLASGLYPISKLCHSTLTEKCTVVDLLLNCTTSKRTKRSFHCTSKYKQRSVLVFRYAIITGISAVGS
jgi:hypothetical protein